MKPNAAGCHCIYLRTQVDISLKADRIINIKAFITQIININKHLLLLPCLKDVEGVPTALKRADVPLKGIELCTLILGTLPYTLVCAY